MVTFRLIYRRALNESYREGRLSKEDYEVLLDAYKRPYRHNEKGEKIDLMAEVEKKTRRHARGWPEIWAWIKENWVLILKLLFSLLPLFVMVDPKQPQD
ncbi:MAG: hypothetical protein WC315_03795 [Candidatus Omnitrophota bacterium]|jgi:hypothetical protein